MKKIVTGVLSAILTAVTALLLIFAVITVFGFDKSVPSFFGYSFLRVVSNSMADQLNAGDFIIIKQVSQEELEVGDIISFYSVDESIAGKVNTHRIVDIKEGKYITKGDANSSVDEQSVSFDRVVGKFQYRLRLSFLGAIMSSNILFFVVVLLPLVVIMVLEFIKIIKLKYRDSLENVHMR